MKKAIWSYVGDMKCPCCGIYSKVYQQGYRHKIYRLDCKNTSKQYFRDEFSYWRASENIEKITVTELLSKGVMV